MFYRIVLQGHVPQGVNLTDVKHQFTRVTGLPPSVTDHLFGSTPNVIKRQVAQADAERIAATLRAIGASVTLEPDFHGPNAGGLDPVTVPALPASRHIELPTEPPAAAPPTPAWRRLARKYGKLALPVGGTVLLLAAALNFAPEVDELVRGLRKTPPPAATAPARTPAAARAASSGAPALNASLLHGPWPLSGVLIGFSISSWKHGLTSILVSLALYIYSRWFKQLPFLGNFWVALISGVAIMYGGATFGWGFEAIWAALFAFGVTLSREITKDIEDMAGDAALGAKTLPIRFGRGTAVFLGSLMMALTILMTPLPYWWNAYGGLYLMVVGVADVLMLRAIWLLATDRETGAHQSSAYLKMAVVVGLIALLLP